MIIKKADEHIINNLLERYPRVKPVLCTGENGYTLVALEIDKIVAFISVFKREIPAPLKDKVEDFINVIDVVDITYQRKGIGSALVGEVKKIAHESGAMQVRAYCDISNEASHALWVKNGFGISPVKNANGSILGSFVTFRL
jgi:RimJ/RimL family protein N-acetyltransferase